MLRLQNLSNVYVRRTLRVLYGQTQAYPYDAGLLSTFSRTGGAIEGTTTTGITGSKSAILPGLVAKKAAGEVVTVSSTWTSSARPFGLFANFVGGEITDIPSDFDRVGVWRGAGSVYELLAPAFSTANSLSSLAAAEDGLVANEVYLSSNAKGQLECAAAGANVINTGARLMAYLSAQAIEVELLV